MQRIDAGVIARRYYDPDTTPHAATPETLARYLRTMLDDLVQLARCATAPPRSRRT